MRVITSPVVLILFGCVVMWLLLDVRFKTLSPLRRWSAAALFAAMLAVNAIAPNLLGSPTYGKFGLLFIQLPLFILFSILSQYGGVKLLFVLLTAVTLTGPTVIIAIIFKSLLSLSQAGILVVNILSYLLVIFLVWRLIKPSFNYMLRHGTNRMFWMFSIIPLLQYVYGFLRTKYYFATIEAGPEFWLGRIPDLIVFVSYLLLLYIFKTTRETNRILSEQSMVAMQLDIAEKQITQLVNSRELTAAYRHDMRHHLTVIDGLIQSGDKKKAVQYIETAVRDIESITPLRYCENMPVNLILSAFAERARKLGVTLSADVDIPATPDIPETELCSLFANGLENSVSAAGVCGQGVEKTVRVSCHPHRENLLILISNPYEGDIVMKDGLPQSGREGHGFGAKSIKLIADRHGGYCSFEADNGVFTLRVVLPADGAPAAFAD